MHGAVNMSLGIWLGMAVFNNQSIKGKKLFKKSISGVRMGVALLPHNSQV